MMSKTKTHLVYASGILGAVVVATGLTAAWRTVGYDIADAYDHYRGETAIKDVVKGMDQQHKAQFEIMKSVIDGKGLPKQACKDYFEGKEREAEAHAVLKDVNQSEYERKSISTDEYVKMDKAINEAINEAAPAPEITVRIEDACRREFNL